MYHHVILWLLSFKALHHVIWRIVSYEGIFLAHRILWVISYVRDLSGIKMTQDEKKNGATTITIKLILMFYSGIHSVIHSVIHSRLLRSASSEGYSTSTRAIINTFTTISLNNSSSCLELELCVQYHIHKYVKPYDIMTCLLVTTTVSISIPAPLY